MLRRFIDDSINLLGEQEFNLRRIDEGLAPVNLIWPWGQGFPPVIPNLALQRGTPCHVLSPALGLRGLSKMCGYTHGPTSGTNAGLSPPVWRMAESSRFASEHLDRRRLDFELQKGGADRGIPLDHSRIR